MHINLQPTFYNQYRKPAFCSCSRCYDSDHFNTLIGSKVYTTTTLFRNDLDFGELTDFMIYNFKDKDKVNIKCLAGSDGSEAYSLAIALKERLPKSQQKKFLPILSLDRDPEVIKAATSGKINLSLLDIKMLDEEVKSNKEYFTLSQDNLKIDNDFNEPENYKSYEVSPELKESINFKIGNLLEEVKNLKDDGNTVVMCRNVTPYLREEEVSTLAYNLNKNLKEGSLCAIGNFDNFSNITNYLKYYGFNQIIHNVFQKGKEQTFY
ncbi:hypothetical protein IKJ53_07520 [bacterium]|nr:hypothetical protein [bacterium]